MTSKATDSTESFPATEREALGSTALMAAAVQSRSLKRVVGCLLLAAVAVGLSRGYLIHTSDHAVVNGETRTIIAPIDGEVTLSVEPNGSFATGALLAAVRNDRVETGPLDHDKAELLRLEGELGALDNLLLELERVRSDLGNRASSFRAQRATQLELERVEVARRSAVTLERFATAERHLERANALSANGLLPAADLEDARSHREIAAAERDEAAARAQSLDVALKAIRSGVLLDPASPDSSYAKQRGDQLTVDYLSYQSQRAQKYAQVAALQERVTKHEQRIDLLREAKIEAGFGARWWQHLQVSGSYVDKGQPIGQVLNCDRLMVSGLVGERTVNSLHRGDEVAFRLKRDGKTYTGTIIQLIGPGFFQANLAVPIAAGTNEKAFENSRYGVIADIPALQVSGRRDCTIGETGELFFGKAGRWWARWLP